LKASRIDLEKLNIPWRHADYIIDAGNTVIVVEETSRAKIEDIEKLENTINAILEGSIKLSGNPEKIVAIIHFDRGMDPMIPRILRSRNRSERSLRYVLYRSAGCNKELHMLLSEYKVIL